MPTRGRPIILVNLYLFDATHNLARKDFDFQGDNYVARVLSVGSVDRSVSIPPGSVECNDAQLILVDTDGQVRDWFDANAPYRRQAEVYFDFEGNVSTPAKLLYSGEISHVKFGPGTATITIHDVTETWLNRKIPQLLTRDNFPNMPDWINETDGRTFAPIIFGEVFSMVDANIVPEGAINCVHFDTTHHRFMVARHACQAVVNVYRKEPNDSFFHLVSAGEYSIGTLTQTIGGITYTFTYIQFTAQQKDDTIVHADVTGLNRFWNFASAGWIIGSATHNITDHIFSLLNYLLQDETRVNRFNGDSFTAVKSTLDGIGYLHDGAITESINIGEALSQMCGDAMIDLYMDNQGRISLAYYGDPPSGGDEVEIDTGLILKHSLQPEIQDAINRFRFRYFHQNAGATEYTLQSATGNWGRERIINNVTDQNEISTIGLNPIVEGQPLEFHFIRDDATAVAIAKLKMCYHALRSYLVEMELPAPEVVDIPITTPLKVTHFGGIGDGTSHGSWTDFVMKCYAIVFDLDKYVARYRAIHVVKTSDISFQISSSADAHDVQTYLPDLNVIVNGDDSNQENPVDFSNTNPPPPDSSDWSGIPSTIPVENFTPGGTGTTQNVPKDDFSYVNVRWQLDKTTDPRQISGYVPIPRMDRDVRWYSGTLYPDQRPTADMDDSDIHKVIFYSTDFDHLYWWVGTGETGTPSGWWAIEQTVGSIILRWDNPAMPGWHKCDGSSVRMSDYKGDTSVVTLPNLYPGTHTADSLLGVGSSPTISATPSLTDNSSLPSCLGSSGIIIDEAILVPWMRL